MVTDAIGFLTLLAALVFGAAGIVVFASEFQAHDPRFATATAEHSSPLEVKGRPVFFEARRARTYAIAREAILVSRLSTLTGVLTLKLIDRRRVVR